MKTNFFLLLALTATAIAITGCINTVAGTKKAAIPFLNDQVEARYERSSEQVFSAAKTVLARNGAIASSASLYNQTNDVRVLEGKIKQSTVWIRIEAIDPHLTGVAVQSRTSHGGADLVLAHEIDKEIFGELIR